MTTIGELVEESVRLLLEAGVDEARLDTRLMIARVLDCTPEHVFGYPDEVVDEQDVEKIRALIVRRENREPLARITGVKEFWSLPFQVNDETLIPRPDSETLIEAVLEALPDREAPLRIIDLGTGTGCLVLALLHEFKNATGWGVDISERALQAAGDNAQVLGLAERVVFVQGDWKQGLSDFEGFDIAISNPPYVPERDKPTLQPEVSGFEPAAALFAGKDGLAGYRELLPLLPKILKKRGHVFVEVGKGQSPDVQLMLQRAGFWKTGIRPDLAGISRCVWGIL